MATRKQSAQKVNHREYARRIYGIVQEVQSRGHCFTAYKGKTREAAISAYVEAIQDATKAFCKAAKSADSSFDEQAFTFMCGL